MLEQLAAPVGTALDRFIASRQEQFPYATGDLSQLLRDIALASKIINREINRAGLADIDGAIGTRNIQGESQQKLDWIANRRFHRAFKKGGQVCCIVSEEEKDIINTENKGGKYIVTIDPLDGSSNIGVNVSVGTIFSIYHRLTDINSDFSIDDTLQKGATQIAAGYVLYGSSTMLVYSTGYGVNGFTYEPSLGEYFLSHPKMTFKKGGRIYSINEGNYYRFTSGIKNYIDHCKQNDYTARYIGSLVADFHRNILKGGIYLYPSTSDQPQGKLRLLYECNALAFIAEQANGKATNGKQRILDLTPRDLHQRTPLFIGSPELVDELMEFLT